MSKASKTNKNKNKKLLTKGLTLGSNSCNINTNEANKKLAH